MEAMVLLEVPCFNSSSLVLMIPNVIGHSYQIKVEQGYMIEQ